MNYYDNNDLNVINEFRSYSPEQFDAFMNWNSKVFCDGALPRKVKELIAIAVAHAVQCPYCIDYHTRYGKEFGVTDAEMAEAIHAASVIRAGAAMWHSIQAIKILKEKK